MTDAIRRRKQGVAWLAGTVAMPFGAYPFVTATLAPSDLDVPIMLVFGACWLAASLLLRSYLRQSLR